MRTVVKACTLQPNATEITVGDGVEKLDELINGENGDAFFQKTFITEGMRELLSKGIARLAGKSNSCIFHLKQAMGGGKTHLMIGFGLLAKTPKLREKYVADIHHATSFGPTKVAAFNGRNYPKEYFWGEIANQLGKGQMFAKYWQNGPSAPDETAWLTLFEDDSPILILLDEMPPYFQKHSENPSTKWIGNEAALALSNMLTAIQKKSNVCIVISDLDAAWQEGSALINQALDNASQEVGRASVDLTPVNLEGTEIYDILRKRLFATLPDQDEIAEIASAYGQLLSEASKAKILERSAESVASEVAQTYPFHPKFKDIVALFKENEKFKQTRGLMELVSRLLKSVWDSNDDVYLIGAQHFDLSIPDVRTKLGDISKMQDVINKDLWNVSDSAHAQIIDNKKNSRDAKQVGALLLLSSLSTAYEAVKGLSEQDLLSCLIAPQKSASNFRTALEELQKTAWYLHQTSENKIYFSRTENLTKKLQGYAEKAPQNQIDTLIRHRLKEMYEPKTKEAYTKVLPLPEDDDAIQEIKNDGRVLLILQPDGQGIPEKVKKFFAQQEFQNNFLILTGEETKMADLNAKARNVWAVTRANKELPPEHVQRDELEKKIEEYKHDFNATILSIFDKLIFPGITTKTVGRTQQESSVLRNKTLSGNYTINAEYNGEQQIINTLSTDPIKLYLNIPNNFDALKTNAEKYLFAGIETRAKNDLKKRAKSESGMVWMPPKGMQDLIQLALQQGLWEDLGNDQITKKPKPKKPKIQVDIVSINESGKVKLHVDTMHAKQPVIYYSLDGNVSPSCPILSESELETNALRVAFLVQDASNTDPSYNLGVPFVWENELKLRCKLDEKSRILELSVVPKGNIKYTLDGSEPRNGIDYTGPFNIGTEKIIVKAFAESEGIETKQNFSFSKKDSDEIVIVKDKGGYTEGKKLYELDGIANIKRAIAFASEKGILFEEIFLQISSSTSNGHITLRIPSQVPLDLLDKQIDTLSALASGKSSEEPAVKIKMKKINFTTGFALEQFVKEFGIQVMNGEVHQ